MVCKGWTAEFVAQAFADARAAGDARRGAGVFNAATTGCTSCHKLGGQGVAVVPELTTIAKNLALSVDRKLIGASK